MTDLSALPQVFSETSAPERPNKSRFRALFSWKRNEISGKEEPVISGTSIDALTQHALPSTRPSETPQLLSTSRSRSTTWSSRSFKPNSRTPRNVRPRAITSWDPPPLFQACREAVLKATLDAPSAGDGLFRHHRASPSIASANPKHSPLSSEGQSFDSQADLHRRNESGSSINSTKQKLYILLSSGHILQYSDQGHNDRLPEKILELGVNTVAIASDALPGKCWVLRVSNDSKGEQTHTQAPKQSWSKLAFRSAETKRLVKDLLLVFETPKEFNRWLKVVRREIEALGGMEYRPDSRGLSKDDNRGPTKRLQAQKETNSHSQSSSHLPLTNLEQEATRTSTSSTQLLTPKAWSRKSTAGSSIATTTELDNLRHSTYSDNTSGTRTSFEESTTSGSPAIENFPSELIPKSTAAKALAQFTSTKPISKKKSFSRPSFGSDARSSSSVEPCLLSVKVPDNQPPSILLATPFSQTSPTSPGLGSVEKDLFGRKSAPAPKKETTKIETKPLERPKIPERKYSETQVSKYRPISILAPLPDSVSFKRSAAKSDRDDTTSVDQAASPGVSSDIASSAQPTSTNTSPQDAQDQPVVFEGRKRTYSSYSLFPKRCSSVDYSQSLEGFPIPTPSTICNSTFASPTGDQIGFKFPIIAASADEDKSNPSTSRPGSRPGSRAHKKSLSTDKTHLRLIMNEKNIAQRSPAVTDAHIVSCFGIESSNPNNTKTSAITDGISSAAVEVSQSVLTAPVEVPVPLLSHPPRHRRVSVQKSMPNLLHSAIPPLGPPPSIPLPEPPTQLPVTASKRSSKHHSRSKSKNANNSQTSTNSRPKHNHARGQSSVSSVNSTVSTESSVPSSPKRTSQTHHRKLSSVCSVGSTETFNTWSAVDAIPSSPSAVPSLSLASPSSITSTPTTPTFASSSCRNSDHSRHISIDSQSSLPRVAVMTTHSAKALISAYDH